MSAKAKLCFLGAFLALVAAVVLQFMTGAWLNLNSVLMGLAAALVVLAIVLDWRLYAEFFTMRTTKHGMNMGMLIILVVTGLVCVNYLANKHNKTWDLTQEKLNSLSDQTTGLLKNLNEDLEIKVFYKGPAAQESRQRIKQSLALYQDYSSKVKVRFVNAYVDQVQAMQYLKDLSDVETSDAFVFIEYKGRKIRAEEPFDEGQITSAMIKATREGEQKIYFVQGHGERDIASAADQGLQDFVKALGESSYRTEALNLIDKKEVPADAAVVAIIGPSVPYLDEELNWLRAYLQRGGRLFVALDPGQRHDLANLTKSIGVQFNNNFVLTLAPIVGGGPATILGRTFDPTSEVTRSLPSGQTFAVFPLASEVKPAPERDPSLSVQEIVKSDSNGFTMNDLSQQLRERPKTEAVSVAVAVKGALGKDGKDAKPEETKTASSFEAVVFGDSDFISNRGLMMGINRDLALNAFAALTNQKDLLSIRPKLPQGTIVTLTQVGRWGVIIGGLSLPLLLLIFSGVMWFRRRGA